MKCPSCGTWVCLDREFPDRLHQEVRIILPRPDGTFYRACPRCSARLDLSMGEWVADFPTRPIHGYCISQLISPMVDPGEILNEYRNTRDPGHFYNLKIGVAWADLDRRLDMASTLALCTDRPLAEGSRGMCTMGVDTGKLLHVVIMECDPKEYMKSHLVWLGTCRTFSEP